MRLGDHTPETLANACAMDSELELKDNTVIVVLGASGDLAKKKTVRCSRFCRLKSYANSLFHSIPRFSDS